jgi:RNA polymerase sigma-70 factor (ECF subfamily)
VSGNQRRRGNRDDSRPGTLGDLLYADAAKTRASEEDWVRLVHSIAAGDPLALHALYARTHRLAFTLILRINRDRQTAEEVTLDVFHDVWRRASQYDPAGGTVLGWIMNQARSRAIDRLRFERRKKRVAPGVESPLSPSAPSDPHGALDLRQQELRLRDALAVLTPEEREAIEAAFLGELTHTEVAARLDQPLGTIKTRIRSGLGKLRAALSGAKQP